MLRPCPPALFAAAVLLAGPPTALAALPPAPVTPAVPAYLVGGGKLEHLDRIAASIQLLQAELDRETEAVRRSRVRPLRRREAARLDAVQRRLDKTRAGFQRAAAELDIEALLHPPKLEQRSLSDRLRELTAPVLDAVRRVSARPRRIEGLRADIAALEARFERATTARRTVAELIRRRPAGTTAAELRRTLRSIDRVIEELGLGLDEKRRSLAGDLAVDTSMVDAAAGAIGDFLGTKGRNLALALLTFALVVLLLMALRTRILPAGRLRTGRFAWLRKPLSALYGTVVFLCATAAGLLCLYLLSDMLLLTLAVLILSFLVWSTRKMLPRVLREVRLMLNLGPVREGERVVWRGLPWRIAHLGLRPELVNPALQGGGVKVRAVMLVDEVSRLADDEPFFPTERGDWVLLPGDVWGRVVQQTPEEVRVAAEGHQLRRYGVAEYLAAGPVNLSHGLLRRVVLPASADLVGDLGTARDELARRLRVRLPARLDMPASGLKEVAVHALPPTPVALQLEVRLTCGEGSGQLWRRLAYETVAAWLELCAERGWEVPAQARLLAVNPLADDLDSAPPPSGPHA